MKPWGDEPEEGAGAAQRIEQAVFAALIAASLFVVLGSLYRLI